MAIHFYYEPIVSLTMHLSPTSLCFRVSFLALFSQNFVFAQQNREEQYAFDVRHHANFTPTDQGVSEIRVDLGEIPAHGTGRVVIVVRNTSQREVNLGDTFSGCKCLKVTLSKPQMSPGDECDIELIFNVQVEPVQLKRVTTTVVFPKSDPDAGTRIALNYRLAGMLAFNQRTASLRVEEGSTSKEVNLPITISSPTRLDQIEVFCEGALKQAKSAIVNIDGQSCVQLTISTKDTADQLSIGLVRIATKDKSRADEINCFIEKIPPLTITPKTLRFRWNDSMKQWESEAIVQVALPNTNGSKATSDKEIRIQVSAGETPIETESKPIRNGLSRVYLRIPGKEAIIGKNKLEWEVRIGGKIFETDTQVVTLTFN